MYGPLLSLDPHVSPLGRSGIQTMGKNRPKPKPKETSTKHPTCFSTGALFFDVWNEGVSLDILKQRKKRRPRRRHSDRESEIPAVWSVDSGTKTFNACGSRGMLCVTGFPTKAAEEPLGVFVTRIREMAGKFGDAIVQNLCEVITHQERNFVSLGDLILYVDRWIWMKK